MKMKKQVSNKWNFIAGFCIALHWIYQFGLCLKYCTTSHSPNP